MDFIIDYKWWFIIPIGIFVLLVIIGLFANEEETEDGESVDEEKVKKRVDFLTGGKASKLINMYDNDPGVAKSIEELGESVDSMKEAIERSRKLHEKLDQKEMQADLKSLKDDYDAKVEAATLAGRPTEPITKAYEQRVLVVNQEFKKGYSDKASELSMDPKTRLIDKYGREVGERLYNQELWRGMTKEMLSDSRYEPDKIKETVLKTKTKVHWFYKAYRTQQSKKFKIRIDLENNIVVSWKDLG